jgi:superfamily I DNA and/or RNA helicase/very-short-patch-repair endonuclease
MKEILEKYSTRLVNISGRNRSLVMKKLYKKRAFDIIRLSEFNEEISEELIRFISDRSTGELRISEDPFEWYNDKLKKLKVDHKKAIEKAIEELKNKENYSEEKIKERFDNKLQEEDEKLRNKQEKLSGYANSIKALIREIQSTEKETGRYELYIGYPFVEGYFKDKTFVKSPLLLFPIEVNKKGDEWYIKNKIDDPVRLNKVFLIGYAKFNEEKIPNINTEYYDLSDFGDDLIEGIIEELKRVNIVVSYNELEAKGFKEISKDTEITYNLGELAIKNNIIMGHFNIANSIYNDYKEMEVNDLSNELMNKLLKNENNDIISGDGELKENNERKDILEKDYYFISDLDYSQEIAVKKAEENSQLVIYGPPGTGKSQTIVNIISQYLSAGKKVLMVSQKKAALDVIYNRAAAINSKMIMFNKDVDKKQFYSTIANRIDLLENRELNSNEILAMAEVVDEKLDKLNTLGNVLTQEQSFGLTLQDMYSKNRIVLGENQNLDKFFRDFRKSYPFEDLKYKELVSICESALKDDKVNKFYRLKSIMGDNKYSLYLKDDMDIYDLEDSIYEIENLLEKYEECLKELKSNLDYFSYSKEIAINNSSLKESANKINENENGELLEKLINGSKFSISYWLNYKKNKAKEEENHRLFEKKQDEIIRKLEEEVYNIKEITERFNCLNNVLISNEVDKIVRNFDNNKEILESLRLIVDVLNKYNEISSLKGTVNDIKEDQRKLLEYVYSKESELEKATEIISKLSELAIQVHISRLQRQYARELEGIDNFETIRKEISDTMVKKRKAVPRYINQKWDNIALENKVYNEKIWKEMYRQCNKKSKLLHIREFVSKFSDSIFDLYPCWLLSPETVSEILPLDSGLFDLIIFDEASQIFIESSIPTIYRGKKVVVAGDDKQLRPSSTFSGKYEEEEESDDIETAAALEEESLLDLAKYSFVSTSLYYHYRSKYDELINFSNYAFYGGKLEISPNISKTDGDGIKAIERIKVNGRWIDRKNHEEAIEVVNLVKDILYNRKENETIGIITFNISQKDLIDDLLELEAGKDPKFGEKYQAEFNREENNEDLSLFVKNIENVQGDERDIIIFSTAYAKNENGRVVASFGSLSQEGGENRLNVAISRAKKKIYLVTSIEPNELSNVDSAKNKGPKLFKKYLEYVKAVSEGNRQIAEEILYSVCDSGILRNEEIHFDSDFENQVYDALKREGLIVDTQIGVSGYKIDLAIYSEEKAKYILGIECDGAAFHSSKSARERDIFRQRYLESRGWNIIRIWSKDWWTNPQRETNRIIDRVNQL